jgi:hypothetical protein
MKIRQKTAAAILGVFLWGSLAPTALAFDSGEPDTKTKAEGPQTQAAGKFTSEQQKKKPAPPASSKPAEKITIIYINNDGSWYKVSCNKNKRGHKKHFTKHRKHRRYKLRRNKRAKPTKKILRLRAIQLTTASVKEIKVDSEDYTTQIGNEPKLISAWGIDNEGAKASISMTVTYSSGAVKVEKNNFDQVKVTAKRAGTAKVTWRKGVLNKSITVTVEKKGQTEKISLNTGTVELEAGQNAVVSTTTQDKAGNPIGQKIKVIGTSNNHVIATPTDDQKSIYVTSATNAPVNTESIVTVVATDNPKAKADLVVKHKGAASTKLPEGWTQPKSDAAVTALPSADPTASTATSQETKTSASLNAQGSSPWYAGWLKNLKSSLVGLVLLAAGIAMLLFLRSRPQLLGAVVAVAGFFIFISALLR